MHQFCKAQWSLYVPPVHHIQQLYVLPTQCISTFCVDLRKKQRLFTYAALTDRFL
jgi:hypothetical protein